MFAEFERSMIQERVKAGLARARDEGVTLGRPTLKDADPARAAKSEPCARQRHRHSQDCPRAGRRRRYGFASDIASRCRGSLRRVLGPKQGSLAAGLGRSFGAP